MRSTSERYRKRSVSCARVWSPWIPFFWLPEEQTSLIFTKWGSCLRGFKSFVNGQRRRCSSSLTSTASRAKEQSESPEQGPPNGAGYLSRQRSIRGRQIQSQGPPQSSQNSKSLVAR